NLARDPEIAITPEAFTEPATVARRVAEHDPDDDRILVGQRALGDFPHLVGDGRRLVKEQEDYLALVVQAGERFGVVFRPRYEIHAPCFGMSISARMDAHLVDVEPMRRDRAAEPGCDFRRCFGA